MAIVIERDTPQYDHFILLHLRGRLKLEMLGLKGRGSTAYAQSKRLFGLKGNRERVLEQLEYLIKKCQAFMERAV